ncbi:MAG: hypothetical protein FJ297_15585 [Planctomycetes bacterium]|nr:hypothetical protein [Planctomycetota bacterium]
MPCDPPRFGAPILRFGRFSPLLIAMAITLGCQGDKLSVDEGIVVKGKLFKGGQPLGAAVRSSDQGPPIPGMEAIAPFQVSLVPEGGQEGHARGAYAGKVADDGSVAFSGPGKGIPPGIYRLVVVGTNTMPDAEGASADPFRGKFTLDKTPFRFTITVAHVGKEFDLGTIDLDRPPSP